MKSILFISVLMLAGCTQYNLTVYKTIVAMPGSDVQMNSETRADGNTSNPTTTAEPSLEVTAVP